MDTADYNAENIKPRIVENYDGAIFASTKNIKSTHVVQISLI